MTSSFDDAAAEAEQKASAIRIPGITVPRIVSAPEAEDAVRDTREAGALRSLREFMVSSRQAYLIHVGLLAAARFLVLFVLWLLVARQFGFAALGVVVLLLYTATETAEQLLIQRRTDQAIREVGL